MSIIKKPIVTEKMTVQSEKYNRYAFVVDRKANKIEIKKSIEERFGVKVKKVSTMNCKGKTKNMSVRSSGRVIRTSGNRSDWKKAIVTLLGEDKIDLINGDFS